MAWITDPKTKEKSVTLTLFITGFVVCLVKLILSGITVGTFSVESFSGGDFAAAIAALGGVYALRRMKPATADKSPEA